MSQRNPQPPVGDNSAGNTINPICADRNATNHTQQAGPAFGVPGFLRASVACSAAVLLTMSGFAPAGFAELNSAPRAVAKEAITAPPIPLRTSDSTASELWVNPNVRIDDVDSPLEVSLASEIPVVDPEGLPVTVTVELHNRGNATISGVAVNLARAGAIGSAGEIRQVLAADRSEYRWESEPTNNKSIGPGETITLTIPLDPADPGLQFQGAGTYPLAIQAFGTIQSAASRLTGNSGNTGNTSAADPFGTRGTSTAADTSESTSTRNQVEVSGDPEYLGGDRFVLQFRAQKQPVTWATDDGESLAADSSNGDTGSPAGAGGNAGDAEAGFGSSAAPAMNSRGMALIWPIAATVDELPGETNNAPLHSELVLENENLADSLAPGGRLDQLVTQLDQTINNGEQGSNPQIGAATTLAIDPMLLETIARMANGYRVSTEERKAVETKLRLREMWGSNNNPLMPAQVGEPGRGVEAARQWLARLKELATRTSGVVALPSAGLDINAAATMNNQWILAQALQSGNATLRNILGVEPVSNVVIPPSGFITPQAASKISYAAQNDLPGQPAGTATVEQWWEGAVAAASPQADEPAPDSPADNNPSLESTNSEGAGRITPPLSPVPMTVLVANNTVGSAEIIGGYAQLNPQVTALTFDSSIAATLAAMGTAPETVAYSWPNTRFDYSLDSTGARALTAATAVRLSAQKSRSSSPGLDAEGQVYEGQSYSDVSGDLSGAGAVGRDMDSGALVVMPPMLLEPGEGTEQLLRTVAEQLTHTHPVSLAAIAHPTEAVQRQLDADLYASGAERTDFGAPFSDPGAIAQSELLAATQQANYTLDLARLMVNDPTSPLTRFAYVAPLLDDLVRGLSSYGRRSYATHDAAISRSTATLDGNRDVLLLLRNGVNLLTPGEVVHRVSTSSPLLVVAHNALPLPVDTRLEWHSDSGTNVTTPGVQRIPAKGSITMAMTADLPAGDDRVGVDLWLATADGQPISKSVHLEVQTRFGVGAANLLSYGLLIVVAGLFGWRMWRFIRIKRNGQG